MSTTCLVCLLGHGPLKRTCAACGEVAYPRAWLNMSGNQWDPMCENCTSVIARSSYLGLQLTEAVGVAFSDE